MNRLLAAARRRAVVLTAGGAVAAIGVVAAAVPSASGAFSARVTNTQDLAATAPYFRCDDALAADRSAAFFQWALTDASASAAAADSSGNGRTGAYQGTMTADGSAPVACPRDDGGGTAWRLDGATTYALSGAQQTNPQTFSIEVAFQTTVKGGKLIGFGAKATGADSQYDRHVYLTPAGGLVLGVYSSGAKTIATTGVNYADGRWHHVAGTFSGSTGLRLYIDGALVAENAGITAAEVYTGYWRVGYDSISSSWPSPPANPWFTGRLRDAAVYTTVLTAQQVAAHAAPVR
ncbi:LamG domain-containing protein [Amnibacterium setariae]|uniref:LamG domain-containing protein n=1 Tax=Amnibacterium setariae TaxID=2306585 RepID=UPI001F23C1D1|nr:LamG domain-containing protein [Amnibacterium setariae]